MAPKRFFLPLVAVFVAVLVVAAAGAWAAEVPRVTAVYVKGNQRIEESTIRFHMKTRVGDPFSVYTIREDLKKIYGLGYFEDVSVDVAEFEGGLAVTFRVVEKPSLRVISVSGNTKIKTEEILTNIPLKEGAILNRSLVQESINVIRVLYNQKGYLFVQVEPLYRSVGENRVDLEFKISEGKKAFVETISFTGNKAFSDKELRKVIETSTRGPFSFLTLSGTYVKEVVANDRTRLVRHYHNHGYIDVVVGEPAVEIDAKAGKIFVTFPITEGPQYRVTSVQVEGDEETPPEQLRKMLSLKEGDIFRKNRLRRDILALTDFYSVQGYAFADVVPLTRKDPERREVAVVLEVDKGKKVYVERIEIEGNVRTRDQVIRRQFRLSEGEAFDSSKLALSRRNIRYTGFFEEVSIETSPGSTDDTVVITTKVEEKPTGVFGIGAGYSSAESALFSFRIQQNNLGGRGQKLSFRGHFSGIRQRYRLNFWEPSVANSTIGWGFGLTNDVEEFPLYDQQIKGFDTTFAKNFRDFWRGSIQYRMEDIELKNVNSSAQGLIAEGSTTVGTIRPLLSYDSRDRRFLPTRGTKQAYSLGVSAKPFGSDVEFWKLNADWRRYFEIREDVVYHPRVRMGFARGFGGQELPPFERFFAGGTYTVRGYKLRDIGPGIGTGRFRRALGGESRFIFNHQIRYPLVRQINLAGVVFLDAGNVYSEVEDFDPLDLRYGTGAGLRLLSPIGPIGLDYGLKLDREAGEKLGEFHLSLGTFF